MKLHVSPRLRGALPFLTRRGAGRALLLALGLQFFGANAAAQAPREGVDVGQASAVRKLVPAEALENTAQQQYGEMLKQAASKKALAPADHPQVKRLRAIAARLIPYSYKFNERARSWRWEINLIGSPQINAFCMPGGKIAFYTGILDQLKLTDDEVAMVMGHEIAHALREHARERVAKAQITGLAQTAAAIASDLLGFGSLGRLAVDASGSLLTLKFSRDDETESDIVGLELAARAGFDPRAGVTLWQKMGAASKGAPPSWLSTHPAGKNRIQEIESHLPQVLPLYEKAKQAAATRGSSDSNSGGKLTNSTSDARPVIRIQ
ncbi:MAG TPA: M48 family metallopeptidase [Rhodocyclaceae bacterium]|nr:M48 family metallopeptidase [Rhodocyclaceae bacterium]